MHRAEPLDQRRLAVARRGLQPQRPPAVDDQAERDLGMGHREPLDHLARGLGLGPLGLEELEPRRGREEQVADLDPGAEGAGGGPGRAGPAALDR